MNKSKKSLYTAATGAIYILLNGLLGMLVIKIIIEKYGSDFNGLNSTISQFLNMLLLLEGGLTIAVNVALLKPYKENDLILINKILSATKKNFLKIGVLFFSFGIISSLIYSFFIKSSFNFSFVFSLFLIAMLPTGLNLLLAVKYRVIIQMDQKEYIINLINIITILCTHLLNIFIAIQKFNIILIRINTMIFSLLNILLIVLYVNKKYTKFNFNDDHNLPKISGTGDIFVQKITGGFYSAFPMLLITLTIGTVEASIYAVYNSIFLFIKGILLVVLNAPKMALGTSFLQKDSKNKFKLFKLYQFISIKILSIFLLTTSILIMPFINIYTRKMTDINYIDIKIAVFMILIAMFEILHIPSGIVLNMTGEFKITKNIQLLAVIVLILSLIFGQKKNGLYGILTGVLITAILLGILEIYIVHKKYFEGNVGYFLKLFLYNLLFAYFLYYFENKIASYIYNWESFVVIGSGIFFFNILSVIIFNFIFFREKSFGLFEKLKSSIISKN